MAEIIKARVWTKVDTLENWNNNPLLLGPGEMALVTTPSGVPLNMKWGDKNERKRFSDLPFAISYDQGQFVAIDGPGELPTPESEVGYSLVGPGTYTYPGQSDIVVEDGRWGQVVYSDGEWSFIDMGELPAAKIPLAIVNAPTGSFDFNTVARELTVSGIGSVNIGDERFLYETPQTISFPEEPGESYFALLFNKETLLFELVVQRNLTSFGEEYVYVATVFLSDSQLNVNGLPTYLRNGQSPPSKAPIWTASRYNTGDVVFHDSEFWLANQVTLADSEPGNSDRWDLLFNKYRRGQLINLPNSVDFDLTNKKMILSGTISVSVGDKRYLVKTPQEIDFPENNGYFAMVLNSIPYQSSYREISMVNVNDITSIDPRYIFVGVLVGLGAQLTVNGIEDYLINGQPKSFKLPNWTDRAYNTGELVYHNNRTWIGLDPAPIVGSTPGPSARWGELHPQKQGYFNGPASSISFNLAEKTITTRGTSAVVINEIRYLVTAGQTIDFPSQNGGYFALLFNKNGNISTVAVANLGSVDNKLILFGTFYHNNNNNTVVVNGIPDYYINDVPKEDRKFSFDSDIPYYNATTDLSMTVNDPTPLTDQFVDYLYDLYDGLMDQYPDYITKEQFGVQEDTDGGELPLYYWRFKPNNLIKNPTGFGEDEHLKIVITAATHGGEKTCGMATWILMDAICNQWENDEYLQALRWNCEFVVVACASPYQWNQNALGLSPGRKNINGVDPNRNWPQGWANGSDDPTSQQYRGPSVLSEIECQHVYNLLQQEFVRGAIAFDFHTFVGSTVPYDIAWVIAPNKVNPQAQAFSRIIAREYKKKLPMIDQDPNTPVARVNATGQGGMAWKTYEAMGYRSFLMEINENFMIVPGYVRNDNYALKFGTESLANMLRQVIKSIID